MRLGRNGRTVQCVAKAKRESTSHASEWEREQQQRKKMVEPSGWKPKIVFYARIFSVHWITSGYVRCHRQINIENAIRPLRFTQIYFYYTQWLDDATYCMLELFIDKVAKKTHTNSALGGNRPSVGLILRLYWYFFDLIRDSQKRV